ALSSGSVRKGTKFDCAKSWSENYRPNVCLRKCLRCICVAILNDCLRVMRPPAKCVLVGLAQTPGGFACELFLTALDQFDLVAFRCVNEGNSTAIRRMWSVRQRIAFCRGVFGELVQIVDFKSEMRQIGADDNRAAPVKFADLNFLIAAWCFEEDEL